MTIINSSWPGQFLTSASAFTLGNDSGAAISLWDVADPQEVILTTDIDINSGSITENIAFSNLQSINPFVAAVAGYPSINYGLNPTIGGTNSSSASVLSSPVPISSISGAPGQQPVWLSASYNIQNQQNVPVDFGYDMFLTQYRATSGPISAAHSPIPSADGGGLEIMILPYDTNPLEPISLGPVTINTTITGQAGTTQTWHVYYGPGGSGTNAIQFVLDNQVQSGSVSVDLSQILALLPGIVSNPVNQTAIDALDAASTYLATAPYSPITPVSAVANFYLDNISLGSEFGFPGSIDGTTVGISPGVYNYSWTLSNFLIGPSQTTLLIDNFTQDPSLNGTLWSVNGPVATAALTNFDTGPTATIITPTITFSSTLGLGLERAPGTYQEGGIQSVSSFTGPFTVTAEGLATSNDAGVLELAISTQNGGAGVSIDGGASGFIYTSPSGRSTHWNLLGQIGASALTLNELYTETISVDASGTATISVSEGGTQLGQAAVSVGTGPFYVILAEGSGASSIGSPDQAYWNSISVTADIAGLPIVTNTAGSQTTFIAPLANSIVEGAGYDILDMAQNSIAAASSAYTMASNGNGTFNLTTTGSSDLVSGVIQVEFSDKTVTIAATNSENEYVALLYQGALGRTPDPAGLEYWEQIAAALPASTQALGVYGLSDASANYNGPLSIAGGFTNSAEFIAKFGSLTNAQFVTQLYSNVLDRAPDSGGFSYWMSELNGGTSREHVLVGFADSAEAISNATAGYTGQTGAHASWLFLT